MDTVAELRDMLFDQPGYKKVLDTDTAYKAVDYIETYTGRKFFPLRPSVEAVTIIDIAHHLSQQCRYSGATRFFYSTAQHCVLLATYAAKVMHASTLDCLQILMHDAAEAYLVDIPRPIKQHMPEFRMWDKRINDTIREWLWLSDEPMPSFQDEIDSRIIVDERAQVMSDSGNDWGHNLEPLGVQITPWHSYHAEQQFLVLYAAWTHHLSGGTHNYVRANWNVPLTDIKFQPWATMGTDVPIRSAEDEPVGWSPNNLAADLLEVDFRGGCGRVRLRDDNGMMVRDPEGGQYPRAATKWVHGNFVLEPGNKNGI